MNYGNVLSLSLTEFLSGLVFLALKEILRCDFYTVEYVLLNCNTEHVIVI